MTKKTAMEELQEAAKERGINTFQKSAAWIIKALGGGSSERSDAVPLAPAEIRDAAPLAPDHDPGGRGARPTAREETGRRERVPLGTMKTKLDYPQRPGYVRRWFNDQGNRLYDANLGGYEFVEEMNEDRKVRVSRRVGTNDDGSPMLAYVMEIKEEFYNEDQAHKQKEVDKIDAAILSGQPREGSNAEPGMFYTPAEGTSIRHGVGS